MPSSIRSSCTRLAPRYASAENSSDESPPRWRANARASRKCCSLTSWSDSNIPWLSATHPGLWTRPFVGEQRHSSRKPSLHHRPITDDRQVHERQRPRDADRAHAICLAAVCLVCRAPQLDRQQILVVQVVGPRQTLESGAAFGEQHRGLEGLARSRAVAATQRGVSLIDRQLLGSAHSLESLRASPGRRDRPTCHCQMLTITVTTSRLTSAIDWAFLLELRSERTQSSAPIRLHRVGDDGIGEARVLDRHRALRIALGPQRDVHASRAVAPVEAHALRPRRGALAQLVVWQPAPRSRSIDDGVEESFDRHGTVFIAVTANPPVRWPTARRPRARS